MGVQGLMRTIFFLQVLLHELTEPLTSDRAMSHHQSSVGPGGAASLSAVSQHIHYYHTWGIQELKWVWGFWVWDFKHTWGGLLHTMISAGVNESIWTQQNLILWRCSDITDFITPLLSSSLCLRLLHVAIVTMKRRTWTRPLMFRVFSRSSVPQLAVHQRNTESTMSRTLKVKHQHLVSGVLKVV